VSLLKLRRVPCLGKSGARRRGFPRLAAKASRRQAMGGCTESDDYHAYKKADKAGVFADRREYTSERTKSWRWRKQKPNEQRHRHGVGRGFVRSLAKAMQASRRSKCGSDHRRIGEGDTLRAANDAQTSPTGGVGHQDGLGNNSFSVSSRTLMRIFHSASCRYLLAIGWGGATIAAIPGSANRHCDFC
jgi:hypothetical protein